MNICWDYYNVTIWRKYLVLNLTFALQMLFAFRASELTLVYTLTSEISLQAKAERFRNHL